MTLGSSEQYIFFDKIQGSKMTNEPFASPFSKNKAQWLIEMTE